MSPMRYSPSGLARLFTFVREASTPNTGQRVEAIQRWSGGSPGDSWCCHFATMIVDLAYHGDAPIPRGGVCEDVHQLATQHGWIVTTPAVDDLFLYVDASGHAHHIGIVSGTVPLTGIAGNTSEDGTSSEGDGVHEHPINAAACVFVRLPRG